jgi:hypothetical protein
VPSWQWPSRPGLGLHVYPLCTDDVFLAVIALRSPHVFDGLAYGYATLWFATPFLLASMLTLPPRDRDLSVTTGDAT